VGGAAALSLFANVAAAEAAWGLLLSWNAGIRCAGCEGFELPDWTKKNFDDLRDVSPEDVHIQWRFAREVLGSPELGVSRFTYEPGARMPWGHRHREQEEAYVVVGGSGRAKLDDQVVELSAWDVLRVAPAVVRSFEAGPEGLDVICIGGRKPEGGDSERFEDPWD
jgi:quercetin dioxygenase-like cupin family protein